ncbi:MAG: RusA family crossover junction endodeoxyribonuclease [Cyanobacteria bacterium P01_F01_bin.116]
MDKPLACSNELLERIQDKVPDYGEIKRLVYDIFTRFTGLDPYCNPIEFHRWLSDNRDLVKTPAPKGGFSVKTHPLFRDRVQISRSLMFIDLHAKISKVSQRTCEYCSRGTRTKSIHTIPVNIAPISQSNSSSRRKSKKIKAFKKAIFDYFKKKESEFLDGCKLCVSVLFVFSKDEDDKDCDNMAKALNDGLNESLIKDDIHIDHLNIMKMKTNFSSSFLILNIRESNLNKHIDVLIEQSHYEPNLGNNRVDLNDFM